MLTRLFKTKGLFSPLTSRIKKTYKNSVWFNDIKSSLKLSPSEEDEIIQTISETIFTGHSSTSLSPKLQNDRKPRIIFLSLSDGLSTAKVIMATGYGFDSTMKSLFEKIDLNNTRPLTCLKIDLVEEVIHQSNTSLQIPLMIERTLMGIAFQPDSNIAFLPEELSSHRLIDSFGNFQSENISFYLSKASTVKTSFDRIRNASSTPIYVFNTLSFFCNADEMLPLFRGQRYSQNPNKASLLNTACAGASYLQRTLRKTGKFTYIYDPKSDEAPKKYNILRHAGTAYSMLEVYEKTQDKNLLAAAKNALDFLMKKSEKFSDSSRCIVEKGFVKLGGSALAAIAISKYIDVTKDKTRLPELIELGEYIYQLQHETGEFIPHKQSFPEGEDTGFVSGYYPGEALLGLLRIHRHDPDNKWIQTASNGAKWLIQVRDVNITDKELNHDHWLLYALNELYRHDPDPCFLAHAKRITNVILNAQHKQADFPDWIGGYYDPPRSTPTATRTEGLLSAYHLFVHTGDHELAEKSLEAIKLGIKFQLNTFNFPESVMYFPNPRKAQGGFKGSLTNPEIRIDYVQHNISSLLGLYDLL